MHRSVLAYIERYDPGIFPQDAQEAYGIDPGCLVNLASNENPYPPPGNVVEAAREALSSTNRYPDPWYRRLKGALSSYLKRPAKNVAVGNGSTEILDMVCKVFLDPFDRIVMTAPSYTMYALMAMLREATVEFVETKDSGFSVDGEFLVDRAQDAKVIFLCSPNNPTGLSIEKEDLKLILDRCEGIVVVDEAYAEFSDHNAVGLVRDHPNLIVARSMSKFFSLAGLRVGYAVADEEVVENLEKVRMPFSISSVAEAAAECALRSTKHYVSVRNGILRERGKLYRALSKMERVHPLRSDANFIMSRIDPPVNDLVGKLAGRGILVRDLTGLTGLEGQSIRITVGRPEENRALLIALSSVINGD